MVKKFVENRPILAWTIRGIIVALIVGVASVISVIGKTSFSAATKDEVTAMQKELEIEIKSVEIELKAEQNKIKKEVGDAINDFRKEQKTQTKELIKMNRALGRLEGQN